MRKHRNRLLMGMALVFVIYVALLLVVNTREILDHLRTYPWLLLIPVVLLKVVAWFLRFWRWHYFLGVIDAQDKISLFDSALLFVAGFAMAVSPGKLAEVLKAVVLRVKTGVPVARSAPVVFAERAVDGVAVLVMSVLAFLLGQAVIDIGGYRSLILLSAALLTFGLIVVQIRPLAYFLLGLLRSVPVARRLYAPIVEFYDSSRMIFQLRHVVPTSALGALAHMTDALGFCIILSGFGLEITGSLFLQAVFITGLTAAIGALSGVPNGAGVTEISSSSMIMVIIAPFHPVITSSVALTVALVDGFFHKWLRVLVGTLVGLIYRRRLFPSTDLALQAALEESQTHKQARHSLGPETSAA